MHQYLDLVGLIMGQMSKDLIKHVLIINGQACSKSSERWMPVNTSPFSLAQTTKTFSYTYPLHKILQDRPRLWSLISGFICPVLHVSLNGPRIE